MDINATIIGQIITFILLVLFTMKFVWPPLDKMMEDRAKKISDGLAAADKGNKELEDVKLKVADELKRVQMRATEIMFNAESRANQIVEESKKLAVKESERIMHEAKFQIEQELMRAKEQLRVQVAKLAVKGAEQILRSEVDLHKHADILKNIEAEL